MKASIADYLRKGFEGPFFLRMVETVLSRDKNWVRWKIENCPSIEKPAVSSEDYLKAKANARKTTANKRLRPIPMGSLDLSFLSDADGSNGLDKMKDTARYQIPSLLSFKSKIELDDMDIEMANDPESVEAMKTAKASKSWRALRIASRSKLYVFERIEDPAEKIDIIFSDDIKDEEPSKEAGDENSENDATGPEDRRPVVLYGPSGVGKSTLVTTLMEKHPKHFDKKTTHTTRKPEEGEENGVDYHFVDTETFNVMRDGDEFLEMNTINGNDYGTSRKVIEGIIADGKVPVMEMDIQVSITLSSLQPMLMNHRELNSSKRITFLHDTFSLRRKVSKILRNVGRVEVQNLKRTSRLDSKSPDKRLRSRKLRVPTSIWSSMMK
jgi:THO complex subunit 1